MSNPPYDYTFINEYNSIISPSTVHIKNTGLARFFKRYLLQEAISRFEFTLPERWDYNYFTLVLFVIGFIFGFDKEPAYGLIPQHGFIGGRTVQYQPYYATIANPRFKVQGSYRLVIGEECSIIKLQPDYCGLYDIVDYYGDMMALTAETVGVNILNSKLSYVFAADNKASAESFKKLYDDIASGNPASFADKHLFDDEGKLKVQLLLQNVGQNFIADRLLDCLGVIRNKFLTDIGIPNANTDKRERLISSEVQANNIETASKVSVWLSEMQKGVKQTRELFGLSASDFDIKFANLPDFERTADDFAGGDDNGNAVNSRNV